MRKRLFSIIVAGAMSGTLGFGAIGCTTTASIGSEGSGGLHASRSKFYSSIKELAADSTEVIVGTATKIRIEAPYSVVTVEVDDSYQPSELGSAIANTRAASVGDGATVEVRQLGTADMKETPVPLLELKKKYLLLLTPSMLAGEAANQFYVTGGGAGIFTVDGLNYSRLVTGTKDSFPAVVTGAELSK